MLIFAEVRKWSFKLFWANFAMPILSRQLVAFGTSYVLYHGQKEEKKERDFQRQVKRESM